MKRNVESTESSQDDYTPRQSSRGRAHVVSSSYEHNDLSSSRHATDKLTSEELDTEELSSSPLESDISSNHSNSAIARFDKKGVWQALDDSKGSDEQRDECTHICKGPVTNPMHEDLEGAESQSDHSLSSELQATPVQPTSSILTDLTRTVMTNIQLNTVSSLFDPNIEYEQDNSRKNIVSYDLSTLLSVGWIVPFRGSICNSTLIATVLVQATVTTLLAFAKCSKDGGMLCIPLPSSYTGLTLLTITSFLLGIFCNNVLQRWWNVRVALGTVMIKSKSLAMSVASIVAVACKDAPAPIKAESLDLLHKIKRYLGLAHALIYKRGDAVTDLSDLIDRGLVTPLEASMLLDSIPNSSSDYLSPYSTNARRSPVSVADVDRLSTSRSSQMILPLSASNLTHLTDSVETSRENVQLCFQVYGWIKVALECAGRAGLLGGFGGQMPQHVVTLFIDLATIEASAAQIDMYVGIQLPYPFVQMSIITIYMFTVQLMVVGGGMIGEGIQHSDASQVLGGYLTCLLMTFVIMGVLHLYKVLARNPIADLPAHTYMIAEESELNRLVSGIWTSIAATEKQRGGKLAILPELHFTSNDLILPPRGDLAV